MSNIREFKREATPEELRMADRLEALAKRVRNGEVNSVVFAALDSKETDHHYVLGQDGIGMIGAIHILQTEVTDVVMGWKR